MIPLTTHTNPLMVNQNIDMSFIHKIALFITVIFIFLVPWGNYVWDGFTRIFGIASLGLAALVVVTHGTHRHYSFFHLFLLIFGSWITLTLLWSPDLEAGKNSAFTVVQLVFISFVISLIINSKNKMRLAYQAYVFGACMGSFIIFYNYLNGIESEYWARYSIQNFEPDGVGIILALAVPMAAYLTTQYQSRLFNILNTLAIPICFFAIFLNATRTASIVAMFGIAYWLFTHRKASLKIKFLLVGFFIGSIVAVLAFAPEASVERIFSSSKSVSDGTLNGRTTIWAASIDQWATSPFIGKGIGSIAYVLSSAHVEYNSAHNTYIHILTETGIIGLFLYLMIIVSILYYIQKTALNDRVFLLSFLLVALVSQLTMNTLFDKEMWFSLTMVAIHAHMVSKRQ